MERKLCIVGKATLKASPDKFKIFIGLLAEANTADLVNTVFTKKITLLNNILIQLGFDKDSLKTENFIIDAKKEWQNNKQVDAGYYAKGDYSLLIDVDYSLLEDIIAKLTQALGIKVTYTPQITDIDQLDNKAIAMAIDDATKKAQVIAEASKVTLGDIVEISYQGGGGGIALMRAATNSSIQPVEDIDITKTIEMVWEIK